MNKLEFTKFRGLIETMIQYNNSRWTDDEDLHNLHLTCNIDDDERIEIYPTFHYCAYSFEEFFHIALGCGYTYYIMTHYNNSHTPTPCLVIF